MATKEIKLNYVSLERFLSGYTQLCKGRIFLPTKTLLPENTRVALQIFIPVVEQEVTVEGVVLKALDAQTAAPLQKSSGLLVGLDASPAVALQDLNYVLSTNADYRDLLDLAPPVSYSRKQLTPNREKPVNNLKSPEVPSAEAVTAAAQVHPTSDSGQPVDGPAASSATQTPATRLPVEMQAAGPAPVEFASNNTPEPDTEKSRALSMNWIRGAIAQEEAIREKEAAAHLAAAPTTAKNHLTEEESSRVRPSGEFLMDLTRAMLRSGYYAPDHPGSRQAKKGLYEAFQRCLADSREIMITNRVTREGSEILINGILDEPVNVRTLVGSGMADLFVPKLQEYFDRKSLVSFAVKRDIPADHFESFMTIMSDPKADTGTGQKIGELLSNALVEHGITQISTVFKDDLIALELNLPWRVEMAIQRLAKDLTVLPMFKSKSDEAVRTMKLQIIQDILRPLKHPEFLKDFIVNCYIIAQHVKSLKTEDIEKVIIEALPLESLLPTSQFIFEELNHLQTVKAEHQDNAVLERRVIGVKRILKWVSQRLVLEDVKGAQKFLEKLYLNRVLTFEELPADVQYFVNTEKMAKDVQAHIQSYVNRFLHIKSKEDATVMLKLFRRILPDLLETSSWRNLFHLTRAMHKIVATTDLFKPASGRPANPLIFVFKDRTEAIVAAYDKVDASQRTLINDICNRLDMMGVEILSKALSESEDRFARKAAMEALIKKGGPARDWIFRVLDTPEQKWYLIRNALMLLGYVRDDKQDIARAHKFLHHEDPRVRYEALNALIRKKAAGTEKQVIAALQDVDEKVRWRAMNGLSELALISEDSIRKLLAQIAAEAPDNKDEADKHNRQIAQLIRALGAIPHIPNHAEAEDRILDIARGLSNQKKGLLERFKKAGVSDQSIVLSSAVNTLGNIGTAKSESFLEKLAEGKSPLAQAAQKAANNIKLRLIEQLSNAPADNPTPAGI